MLSVIKNDLKLANQMLFFSEMFTEAIAIKNLNYGITMKQFHFIYDLNFQFLFFTTKFYQLHVLIYPHHLYFDKNFFIYTDDHNGEMHIN